MYKVKNFKDSFPYSASLLLNDFIDENNITDYEVLYCNSLLDSNDNIVMAIVIKYREAPEGSVVTLNDKVYFIGKDPQDALNFLSNLDFLIQQESEDISFGNVEPIVENGEDIYKII